jgi:hypothetical protein
MTAHKETLIFCDGADGGLLKTDASCPLDGPYGDGDSRTLTAAQQRNDYVADGWLYRGGKDYCPSCAKAIFGYVHRVGGRD